MTCGAHPDFTNLAAKPIAPLDPTYRFPMDGAGVRETMTKKRAHRRNTTAMLASPRCGARTRS